MTDKQAQAVNDTAEVMAALIMQTDRLADRMYSDTNISKKVYIQLLAIHVDLFKGLLKNSNSVDHTENHK